MPKWAWYTAMTPLRSHVIMRSSTNNTHDQIQEFSWGFWVKSGASYCVRGITALMRRQYHTRPTRTKHPNGNGASPTNSRYCSIEGSSISQYEQRQRPDGVGITGDRSPWTLVSITNHRDSATLRDNEEVKSTVARISK